MDQPGFQKQKSLITLLKSPGAATLEDGLTPSKAVPKVTAADFSAAFRSNACIMVKSDSRSARMVTAPHGREAHEVYGEEQKDTDDNRKAFASSPTLKTTKIETTSFMFFFIVDCSRTYV